MTILRCALAVAACLTCTPLMAADDMRAEVIHWWTSGGEAKAVKVLAQAYDKAGGVWVDEAVAGGDAARAAGVNRVVGGKPPTMMQFNTGRQLDELVKNGLLINLDAQAKAEHWASVLPKVIDDALIRDGHHYAIPINIHGQNWLFYNKQVFAAAGASEPHSWADVIEAGKKIKASGKIALAHGGQPWQDHILFDAVLAGQGGSDLYRRVYGPDAAAAITDLKFKQVAETFKDLRDLMDPGMPGRNWNDASSLVITGKAGMQVMGDWAKAEFAAAGDTPGQQYGCVVPGAGGYVIGGDVFVFPKQPGATGETPAQSKLAEIIFSKDIQLAFNQVKGSIPVRTDISVAGLDMCAQLGAEAVEEPARILLSTSYLISPDENGALDDVITQFLNTSSETADAFVRKFADAVEASN